MEPHPNKRAGTKVVKDEFEKGREKEKRMEDKKKGKKEDR
jgi:hypothetical protein